MQGSKRFTPLLWGAVLVVCFATSAAGQTATSEKSPFSGKAVPSYVRAVPVPVGNASAANSASSGILLTFPAKATSSRQIFSTRTASSNSNSNSGPKGNSASNVASNPNGNIPGLMTVPSFAGAFAPDAGFYQGSIFPYVMLGNDPQVGGKTVVPTAITIVSLQLLGVPPAFSPNIPYSFEDLTEDSPNFNGALYTDGDHIQFADAIQRAEFYNTMGPNWHTSLDYKVVNRVTIQIPRFVNVQLSDGSIVTVQAYYVGTAPDGTQFIQLLDLLFNFFYQNQVVNDINANNDPTNAVNMQLWPNTFLFSIDQFGNPGGCCVLGFHTYFYEPGVVPQPIWLSIFASWISPGLFGAGFSDVTGLSHEISETFNDPFLNNSMAPWQFPGNPGACQGNLETGDPVEVLANATFPITLKEGKEVFVYHPQTEALLQWFEMGATSNAIGGAFSYPDTTALPKSAVPCF